MARPPMRYQDSAAGLTVIYRWPAARGTALWIMLWCLLGGAALGVGAAVVLAVLGWTALDFGPVALIGTVLGAVALYALIVPLPGGRRDLRITFQQTTSSVEVRRPGAQPDVWDADDVLGFRLVRLYVAEREAGCRLMMDTRGGPVELARDRANCADDSDLAVTVEFMNARLHALLAAADDLPPVFPARVRPREELHGAPAPRFPLPDLTDFPDERDVPPSRD